jgi:hypothetical protein
VKFAQIVVVVVMHQAAWSAAISDVIYDSAQSAWSHGQSAAAADLLRQHPALPILGRERLLLARCLLATGRPDEALSQVWPPDAGENLSRWPAALRAQALQTGAEALIARDGSSRQAVAWISAAIDGRDVPADRCLLLLAEQLISLGDRSQARRCLERLWGGYPRSEHRPHAGVELAKLLAEEEPLRARETLAAVRAMDRTSPGIRLQAAELLCRLLIDGRPGQCLVVAEQDSIRCPGDTGLLPLYHALAMAKLSPSEGLAELERLPDQLRNLDAARVVIARLREAADRKEQQSLQQRLELAEAAAALRRWPEVGSLLEPVAREEAAALIQLARLPGFDPTPYLDAPSARQPQGAIALAQILIQSSQERRAWLLLKPVLETADRQGAAWARLLYWAGESVRATDATEFHRLRQQLLLIEEPCLEAGMAWCDEARQREESKIDAHEAWLRAARALPADHPWQSAASWRAARWLFDQEKYAESAEILAIPAAAGDTADNQRCRFLLAHALARLGRKDEAKQLAESLRDHADADQKLKLQRLIDAIGESDSPN